MHPVEVGLTHRRRGRRCPALPDTRRFISITASLAVVLALASFAAAIRLPEMSNSPQNPVSTMARIMWGFSVNLGLVRLFAGGATMLPAVSVSSWPAPNGRVKATAPAPSYGLSAAKTVHPLLTLNSRILKFVAATTFADYRRRRAVRLVQPTILSPRSAHDRTGTTHQASKARLRIHSRQDPQPRLRADGPRDRRAISTSARPTA